MNTYLLMEQDTLISFLNLFKLQTNQINFYSCVPRLACQNKLESIQPKDEINEIEKGLKSKLRDVHICARRAVFPHKIWLLCSW